MPASRIVKRISISVVIGLVLGAILSEASYYFLKTGETRPPQVFVLEIPSGTAERLAQGQADPLLPQSMVFVLGDSLQVNNRDSATHQLGPLVIPAHASATLLLNTVQDASYACSFQPDKRLGLTVQPSVSFGTRLFGILEAGLPMGIIFALYSVIAFPVKKQPVQ